MTKKNPESNRYQGSNRRERKTGRESTMSTALITCHCCKKPGHKSKRLQKIGEIIRDGKV